MMKRRIVLLSFLITASLLSFSQEKYLGLSYGTSRFGGGKLSDRFHDADLNFLGLRYQIEDTEKKYRLNFLGGFEGVFGSSNQLAYFKTGVGADLIGNGKLFPVLGLGLNFKLLLVSPNSSYKVASLGGAFNAGLGYRVSSSFFLDVLYQFQFGIFPSYVSYHSSSGGAFLGVAPTEVNEFEKELLLKVGVHFLINPNK